MTGTNFSQEDYLKLASGCLAGDVRPLTDTEATLLINSEFGFEASRIEILHEAEIDMTESGSRYVQIKKVVRDPVLGASDWNYIRFTVHTRPATWYYEMINSHLHFVEI